MRSTAAPPERTWDGVLAWTGSVRAAAVLRIALGPITLLHLRPFLEDAADGVTYHDHFWEPFLPGAPELPEVVWFAMLWIGAGAAVLLTLGLWTRLAAAVAFTAVATNLLLSQTHFRHNRAFLVILLGAMVLLPVGRALSVDAWWQRRRGGLPNGDVAALWPLWLVRTQVCGVYLASGVSKLVDPDWFGGLVLWDRVVRYQHVLEPTPLPDWAVDTLTSRWLYYAVGPAAVLTELFVGLGLWFARTRLAALWVAIMFHVMIEVSASVEVFSLAAIAALAIWVVPVTRDRTVRLGGDPSWQRSVAVLVRTLDWFGRFRIETGDRGGERLTLVDRDGTMRSGTAAALLLLSRIPLTFPLAAPALALSTSWHRRPHLRRTAGAT